MAQRGRVGEGALRRPYLPDAVVGLVPLHRRRLDEAAEALPEPPADHAAPGRPLVGAIDDLAEDVVLALLGGRVAEATGAERR